MSCAPAFIDELFVCLWYNVDDNRFRPVEQGSQGFLFIVLGLIVFILIGLIHDFITQVCSINREGLPMKTKMKKAFVAITKSILNSVWTVGANLLAGALLA